MKIVKLTESSPHLEEIIKLGKKHNVTLGFLPRGAYLEAARKNRVLAALEEDVILGYLLYGVNQRNSLAYVVHLCIREGYRKKGVARFLFDELKNITRKTFRGIRVNCRRDFDENAIWPRLGFTAVNEKRGRGKKQSTTLSQWWYDHGHPDLFSITAPESSRVRIPVDANIFFDLLKGRNKDSNLLRSEWLENIFDLCVTDEIFNEISRQKDAAERVKSRSAANKFTSLTCVAEKWEKPFAELQNLFQKKLTERDLSDLRHLAKVIGSGASCFLTRDGNLLKKKDQIFEIFNITILRPVDFIIQQDEILREVAYQPARLAAEGIEIKKVSAFQERVLVDVFHFPDVEKRDDFAARINLCLADPRRYESRVIQNKNAAVLALFVTDLQEGCIKIPLLRVSKNDLANTLSYGLVQNILAEAIISKREVVEVQDPFISSFLENALRSNGFFYSEGSWFKFNIIKNVSKADLGKQLGLLIEKHPNTKDFFEKIIKTLNALNPDQLLPLIEIEKLFWPAKILDLNLPTFIVPIKPFWAMHLFEENLAKEDLFGSQAEIFFNYENVYYRSARPTVLTAPSRVLWYVSNDKSKSKRKMNITATSYIDEVLIDSPKVLFSQFKRLGVYQWDNVYRIAKRNINKKIMAFRFSGTELFLQPITLATLREIWKSEMSKEFIVQSPIEISNELFFKIYSLGEGNQDDPKSNHAIDTAAIC